MAGEVLPGQQMFNASPFQVINPSGVGGGESIQTIGQVGEGNRNRQTQMAIAGAQNRESQADRASRERVANKELDMQQTAMDRETRRYEDEQVYRQKTEKLSELNRQYEDQLQVLRNRATDEMSAITDEERQEVARQYGEIMKRKSENERKILAIEALKGVHSARFGKPDEIIKPLDNMISTMDGLGNIYNLKKKSLSNTVLNYSTLKKDKVVKGPAQMGEDGRPLYLGEEPAQLMREDELPSPTKGVDGGAPAPSDGSEFEGLTDFIMQGLVPNTQTAKKGYEAASTEDVRFRVKELMMNLAAADDARQAGDSATAQAAMKSVRDDYRALRDMGVNTKILDGSLTMLYEESGSAPKAMDAADAKGRLEIKQGEPGVDPGPTVTGDRESLTRLNRMLGQLSTLVDDTAEVDPNSVTAGRPKMLVQDFGAAPMGVGDKGNWVRETVLQVLGAIGRKGDDWEEAVGKLTDDDPANDVDVLGDKTIAEMGKLPKEVKDWVQTQMKYAAEEATTQRKSFGVEGERLNRGELHEKVKGVDAEKEKAAADISQKYSSKRRDVRETRRKDEEAIQGRAREERKSVYDEFETGPSKDVLPSRKKKKDKAKESK